ncbi:Hypothetical predicted protein, partial [Pelobates cultripes]
FHNHFDADEIFVGLLDVNFDVNLDILGLVKYDIIPVPIATVRGTLKCTLTLGYTDSAGFSYVGLQVDGNGNLDVQVLGGVTITSAGIDTLYVDLLKNLTSKLEGPAKTSIRKIKDNSSNQ